MAVESVAGCPWNGWPNAHGISGRMSAEFAIWEATDDFQAPLASLYKRGMLVLTEPEEAYDFEEAFKAGDIVWRLHTVLTVLDAMKIQEDVFNRRPALAACCLFRLDDVVIADLLGGEGIIEAFAEATDCMTLVEQQELVTTAIKSHNAAKARERAQKRREPTTQLKQLALDLYAGKEWKSVRQATKSIYPQLVEKSKEIGFRFSDDRGFQTVYEWLLEANKTISVSKQAFYLLILAPLRMVPSPTRRSHSMFHQLPQTDLILVLSHSGSDNKFLEDSWTVLSFLGLE